MAEHRQQYKGKTTNSNVGRYQSVSPDSWITTVVSLILLTVVLTGCNNGSTNTGLTPAQTAQQHTDIEWAKQKAKETGGDFNKLNPADQKRLTTQYGNQAPNILRGMAQPPADNY